MYPSTATDISLQNNHLMAAIDLGSNSFHILIVDISSGHVIPLRRWGEKVQLAADCNKDNKLAMPAKQRAVQCLQGFVNELVGIPPENISVVGTDIFRRAKDIAGFVEHIQAILNAPVSVISGEQEARFIFRGVLEHLDQKNIDTLVLDIGGGSTEVALGNQDNVTLARSLPLGCIEYGAQFFPEQCSTPGQFAEAVRQIRMHIELLQSDILPGSWQRAIGTSGTILSIESILQGMELSNAGISQNSLSMLVERVCSGVPLENLRLVGLPPGKSDIFLPGLAILSAFLEGLGISNLQTCQYDLREGLIATMLDRR